MLSKGAHRSRWRWDAREIRVRKAGKHERHTKRETDSKLRRATKQAQHHTELSLVVRPSRSSASWGACLKHQLASVPAIGGAFQFALRS